MLTFWRNLREKSTKIKHILNQQNVQEDFIPASLLKSAS